MSLPTKIELLVPTINTFIGIAAQKECLDGTLYSCSYLWKSTDDLTRHIFLGMDCDPVRRIVILLTIWKPTGESEIWHLDTKWLEDLRAASLLARIESAFVTLKHWNPWEDKSKIKNSLA